MVPFSTAWTGVLRGDRMSTASWPRLPPARRSSNPPFHESTLAPSIGTRSFERGTDPTVAAAVLPIVGADVVVPTAAVGPGASATATTGVDACAPTGSGGP